MLIRICGHSNATALTVNNIIKALQGLHWRTLGRILWVPYSKRNEISQENPTNEQRKEAVVRYWLLRDPLASWRRILYQLDWNGEHGQADTIRHYAEELTGMCVMHYTTQGIERMAIDLLLYVRAMHLFVCMYKLMT